MPAREDDTTPSREPSREDSQAKSNPGRGRPPSDAVARALAEVEQMLGRLKTVRAERAEAEARFGAELAGRDQQIEELRAGRDADGAKLADMEAGLAESAQLRGQLEHAEQRVIELDSTLDRERRESEVSMNELREGFAAAEGLADEQTKELRGTIEALGARADDAEALAATRESAEREALSRTDEVRAELASARTRLDEMESALSGRSGEAEEAAQNASILGEKVADQASTIERLTQELDSARETLDSQSQTFAERGGSLEAESAQLRSEMSRLEAEVSAMDETLEAATRAAADRDEQGRQAGDDREAERAASEAQIESVRAELTEAVETERGQVRGLTEELELAADRLEELRAAVEERDTTIARFGDTDEAVAALNGQVDQLREQLSEAQRQRDEAHSESHTGDASAASRWGDEGIETRRRRLHRCRSLLRERATKATRVEAVLEQRLKLCDDVLGRRRELVEARQIIEKAHKKVTSGRARSGAAVTVFFGVAIVTVLAGLSWAVVSRTFPATYAASAVLAADFGDEAVTVAETEAWQAFHEQLLFDPNVMARVAERMTQRGFESVGQPAVVKTMLEADMTWSSPEAGTLAFELRGLGREATARRLDTYMTTLSVEANALRQRRSETSTTVVIEPARSGVEPIEDPRLQYAGIGLAGGAAISFVLWFGLWRRMVKTKSAFEHGNEIEGLLEEAKWVDPIQQIIDARAENDDARAA
jgi:SMC interacting uncharacterized protein involved in chromosome segregation